MATQRKGRRTVGPVAPREVWIVFVDHSALGIWLTEGEAMKAVNMRRSHSLMEVAYTIQGYRAIGGGK